MAADLYQRAEAGRQNALVTQASQVEQELLAAPEFAPPAPRGGSRVSQRFRQTRDLTNNCHTVPVAGLQLREPDSTILLQRGAGFLGALQCLGELC